MTRRWATAFVAMTTAMLLAVVIVDAQQSSASLPTSNLAVQIVHDDKHESQFPVLGPPEGGFMETGASRQLPDWKQPVGVAPLTRLRFRALMEGDAVRIKVAAVFDDSYPVDSPGAKYGAREEPVASYLAKEGEAITVGALERFGIEPLLLKVVKSKPELEERPLACQPEVISKLKSIEVVAFGSDLSSPRSFRLSLRNVTSKNITALEIYETEQGRRSGSQTSIQSAPGHPVIAAGAAYETQVSVDGSRGRMTPQGFVPEPQQQLTFVVGTVVFDNGTYEGEAEVAARIEALQVGRRIQFARVVSLLKDIPDAQERGAMATLEKLKSQVSSLRIDVEVSIVSELLASYPCLANEHGKEGLIAEVMNGLRNGREEFLHTIKEFEQSHERASGGIDFRTWLSRTKERYAAMTSRF